MFGSDIQGLLVEDPDSNLTPLHRASVCRALWSFLLTPRDTAAGLDAFRRSLKQKIERARIINRCRQARWRLVLRATQRTNQRTIVPVWGRTFVFIFAVSDRWRPVLFGSRHAPNTTVIRLCLLQVPPCRRPALPPICTIAHRLGV